MTRPGHALETAGAWLLGVLWVLPLAYAFWTAFHPSEFSTRFVLTAPLLAAGCARHVALEKLPRREADRCAVALRAALAGYLSNLGMIEAARTEIEQALGDAPEVVHVMVQAVGVYQSCDPATSIFWLRQAVGRGYGFENFHRDPALEPLRGSPLYAAAALELGRLTGGTP